MHVQVNHFGSTNVGCRFRCRFSLKVLYVGDKEFLKQGISAFNFVVKLDSPLLNVGIFVLQK